MKTLPAAALLTAALIVAGCSTTPAVKDASEEDIAACELFQKEFEEANDALLEAANLPEGDTRNAAINELNGQLWETKETAAFAAQRAYTPVLADGLRAYHRAADTDPLSTTTQEAGYWVDEYCAEITGHSVATD